MDTIIVFFHGLKKDGNDWNITNRGIEINIEKTISKKYTVKNITFTDYMYNLPFDKACHEINLELDSHNVIIVGHSIGGLYALTYASLYPDDVKGLILIDSTLPTRSYNSYLENLSQTDNMRMVWYKNFHLLPKPTDIPNINIVAHYNHIYNRKRLKNHGGSISYKIQMNEKLEYYNKLPNITLKEYKNSTHMLHYKYPNIIIQDIIEMHGDPSSTPVFCIGKWSINTTSVSRTSEENELFRLFSRLPTRRVGYNNLIGIN